MTKKWPYSVKIVTYFTTHTHTLVATLHVEVFQGAARECWGSIERFREKQCKTFYKYVNYT